MTLASPNHQEMNGQVKVTWITLRSIAHSLMVHARVSEAYIHFAFIYTIDRIFPVQPIKYLINGDGNLTSPFKLATGTKTPVSHSHVLFCTCVVQKATANAGTKELNMRHQEQKGFRGIFVEIPQHQKGCLLYVPTARKMIYSYDVVFDEKNLAR